MKIDLRANVIIPTREERKFAIEFQDHLEALKAMLAVAPDADRERLTLMAIRALVTR